MWKYKLFLTGVLGVLCLLGGGVGAYAAEAMPNLRHVSGEIERVDVNLGRLELREEGLRGYRATTEYRINKQATNVTDPSDQQFLALEDLGPGQHVAIEFERVGVRGEKMARKITVESRPEPAFREETDTLGATTTTTTTTTTRTQ